MKKITFLFSLILVSAMSFAQTVMISEIDAATPGTDVDEFIEIKTANPNTSLNGYIVVLFNGSNDQSYATYDLAGFTTDANGYLLLANDGFSGMDISLGANNGLQNGADGVAIYQDSATNFPNGTAPTTTNLVDAIVYGTNDPDATGLMTGLNESVQYDEDVNGDGDNESIQRHTDGTYCVGAPTPKATNINCANACPLVISIDSVICDAETTGTDTYTITASFTGGGTDTYIPAVVGGTVDMANSNDPSTSATGVIIVNAVEGTDVSYTITSVSGNCNITGNVTSPLCSPVMQVGDIATLRAQASGTSQEFELTGEAILTYQQAYRNQKYIQDATAAILIDDEAGTITTTYNQFDGITNITGTLSEFNGVLQFVPTQDTAPASSTGNSIAIQFVTISDFSSNYDDYESELIAFQNVVITEGDGTTTFATGTNYTVADTSAPTIVLRTNFFDADYIGTVIQDTPYTNIVGIAAEFNGSAQFTPRATSDFNATIATNNANVLEFVMYPNPTEGILTIEMNESQNAQVTIFDILGKQVISQTLENNTINVSNLTGGMYIVKVESNNTTATKKLIVR